MARGRPRLDPLVSAARQSEMRDYRKGCKVVSREGVGQRPEFMDGMLPASVRYLVGVNKRYGQSKPLSDPEQRILDACLWLEGLTGQPNNKAAIVAALANLPHAINASDWMTILHKRGLVEFENLAIKLRGSGRSKANIPAATPTLETLHGRLIAGRWGPYRRVLKALIDRYPQAYTHAELAAEADVKLESFAFDHAVKSLIRQRLIEYRADGRMTAAGALFPAKAMS